MRKRCITWLAGMFLATSSILAQGLPLDVVTALKSGNANDVGLFLSSDAVLTISKTDKSAGSDSVVGALGRFFSEKRVRDFSVIHKGSREKSGFIIGTLSTADGNFRVNCLFKKIDNNFIIHQIRIDRVNG